jgi:hypothetical protein
LDDQSERRGLAVDAKTGTRLLSADVAKAGFNTFLCRAQSPPSTDTKSFLLVMWEGSGRERGRERIGCEEENKTPPKKSEEREREREEKREGVCEGRGGEDLMRPPWILDRILMYREAGSAVPSGVTPLLFWNTSDRISTSFAVSMFVAMATRYPVAQKEQISKRKEREEGRGREGRAGVHGQGSSWWRGSPPGGTATPWWEQSQGPSGIKRRAEDSAHSTVDGERRRQRGWPCPLTHRQRKRGKEERKRKKKRK